MKNVLQLLKLLPFPIVTAIIVLFWIDDFVAIMIAAIFWWLSLPAIILSIVFFFMGLRWRNEWHRIAVIWGGVNVLLLVAYLIFQVPNQRCDPDIMGKHYEKHRAQMEELHRYVGEAVADSCAVTMQFDGKIIDRFHVTGPHDEYPSMHWNEDALALKDSLMAVVGLTEEEFEGIRQRLREMGCKGIEYSQNTPAWITIRFRYVGFGGYDYIIYNRPMTDEERATAIEDMTLIPYSDRCVFQFGGGAIGPQEFSKEFKEEYLQRHQPW